MFGLSLGGIFIGVFIGGIAWHVLSFMRDEFLHLVLTIGVGIGGYMYFVWPDGPFLPDFTPKPQLSAEEKATLRVERRLEKHCGEKGVGMAFAMSQTFMDRRLTSPGSAKYPWAANSAVPLKDCAFKVRAYVDSQNSFGAMIRTQYRATLEVNPETEKWTLIEMEILN